MEQRNVLRCGNVVLVADEAGTALGRMLRRQRTEAGLTQQEVAERSGLSMRTVGNLERGSSRRPYPASVRRFARAVGMSGSAAEELIGLSRRRDRPADGGGPPSVPLVVPRQLPAEVRHFVGRARELDILSTLLDKSADPGAMVISAVQGTAGVGKSALAVYWAHRAADRFPDGQLYMDLRGFDPAADPVRPADAVGRFLDALGVPGSQVPSGTGAKLDLYRSLLASRRMLVVLDNARDAAQVRPLLPGGRACAVVVTSRSQLTSLVAMEEALPVPLDVLTVPEARELLSRRLGEDRVAADPAAATELAELCARLPLALASAAADAALHPGMPLRALVTRLRDAAGRLNALDAGLDASVRAVFWCSYQHLPEAARYMFRLLGVHPGPDITAPAAASLAGAGPDHARATLGRLTEANLLAEYAPGRFRFHDLLRVYAGERARAEDSLAQRRAAMGRALDHYLHTAYSAALALQPNRDAMNLRPPQPGVTPEPIAVYDQAMAWLEAERQVLLAVSEHAASNGFDSHAWQLPLCLAEFFDRRGYWRSYPSLQRAALAAARRLGDLEAQALVHRLIGRSALLLGSHRDAEYHYDQALSLYRQLGDRAGQARVHLGIGFSREQQGQYREALTHCTQALDLYRAVGDRDREAVTLNDVGWCHAKLGDYLQALTCCRKAVSLHREHGDKHSEAHALDSVGYACHHLGRYAEAISCYQQALDLFEELGDRLNQAEILGHLSDTYEARGELLLAAAARKQSAAIHDELRGPSGAARLRSSTQFPAAPHRTAVLQMQGLNTQKIIRKRVGNLRVKTRQTSGPSCPECQESKHEAAADVQQSDAAVCPCPDDGMDNRADCPVGGDERSQQLRPVWRNHAEADGQRRRGDHRHHRVHPALESLRQLGLDDCQEDPVRHRHAEAYPEKAGSYQQQIRSETCQHREYGQYRDECAAAQHSPPLRAAPDAHRHAAQQDSNSGGTGNQGDCGKGCKRQHQRGHQDRKRREEQVN